MYQFFQLFIEIPTYCFKICSSNCYIWLLLKKIKFETLADKNKLKKSARQGILLQFRYLLRLFLHKFLGLKSNAYGFKSLAMHQRFAAYCCFYFYTISFDKNRGYQTQFSTWQIEEKINHIKIE